MRQETVLAVGDILCQVLVGRSHYQAVVTGGGPAAAATVVDLSTLTMWSPTPLSYTP